MPQQFNRRDILKGIGAGAMTMSAVGPVTAAQDRQYIVTAQGTGVRTRIERAGFRITRELVNGDVLLAEGTGTRDELEAINGVEAAAQDYQFKWENLNIGGSDNPPTDDDLLSYQWDKRAMVSQRPTRRRQGQAHGLPSSIVEST